MVAWFLELSAPSKIFGIVLPFIIELFVAQLHVLYLPAMQETWVPSLSQEDPLEKGMATHSSILAWRIPWTEIHGRLRFIGPQRIGHNWAINLPPTSCCCCSTSESCTTLCDPMDCSMLGFPLLHYLLEFAQTQSIESVMPSNHLILSHPSLWNYPVHKSYHTTFWGCTHPLWWPTLCLWSVFSLNKSTSYLSLCLSLNSLQWDIKNLSFIKSWNRVCDLSWKTVSFDWDGVLESWCKFLSDMNGFNSPSELYLGQTAPSVSFKFWTQENGRTYYRYVGLEFQEPSQDAGFVWDWPRTRKVWRLILYVNLIGPLSAQIFS